MTLPRVGVKYLYRRLISRCLAKRTGKSGCVKDLPRQYTRLEKAGDSA
jgi:hypothetical protein